MTLNTVQVPPPEDIPMASSIARMPLSIPPATSAGRMAEKMPVMISNTLPIRVLGASEPLCPSRSSTSRNTSATMGPMMI